MTLAEAQADMRHAFLGGSAGVFASALAWLAAGIVALAVGPYAAVAALLIGGMLIHPAAIVISKLAGRPGKPAAGNPLTRLALESTAWMLLAIPAAFMLGLQWAVYFFLAMLMTIGGRYLTFATLYGSRICWVLGAVLAASVGALVAVKAPVATAAFTGAAIELVFAGFVYRQAR